MQHQKRIDKYIFNLKRLLGQGSYASVYRGRLIETLEPVAVKVIDKRIFSNSFNLKNLHSQIDIMKRVTHQNIVRLHDVLQTSNNMYIITELCDLDLYRYLRQKHQLDEEEAVGYLKQIMKGVKYLNGQNIIHRDLKPANILMKAGECKISDFGFARNLEGEQSIMKSIVGTPLYMSPQLLQKQKYTNKSDLWSIGLIFYEMLHGRTPWVANTELQLLTSIYSQKIKFNRGISQNSKDFILRCLAIEEQQRISWEEAFEHPLLMEKEKIEKTIVMKEKKQEKIMEKKTRLKTMIENKSDVMLAQTKKNHKEKEKNIKIDTQNNSNLSNVEQLTRLEHRCITPKLRKNISEIRLKKVEALTPKSSFANINHKLKQVWAMNNFNQGKKQVQGEGKRRNLTMHMLSEANP